MRDLEQAVMRKENYAKINKEGKIQCVRDILQRWAPVLVEKNNNSSIFNDYRLLSSYAFFPRACTHGKVQIFLNFIPVLITLTNTRIHIKSHIKLYAFFLCNW